MFVRYIDGDNVSFKELFRNIKSPIVFTSAWTCFKFIFKVIGAALPCIGYDIVDRSVNGQQDRCP